MALRSWSGNGRARFVQPRFPPLCCIAMNDSALGGFVERRNKSAPVVWVFVPGGDGLLHLPQTGADRAIAETAGSGLPSPFRSGSGVGHERRLRTKNWAGRLAESARFVKLPLAGPRLRGRTLSAARAGHVAAGSGTLLLHGRCGLAGAKRGGPTNFHGSVGRAILINHFRLGDSRQTVRHDLHHGA